MAPLYFVANCSQMILRIVLNNNRRNFYMCQTKKNAELNGNFNGCCGRCQINREEALARKAAREEAKQAQKQPEGPQAKP
jgi:hypothetical protein